MVKKVSISANNEIDNMTIVKKILQLMNKSEELIEFVEDRPGHDFRYSLDSTKITKELGWKINTTFDEGIKNTVQWYLENPDILNNISSTVLDSTPWKSSN
jgi:dTDP-glucose 4,6-dehydratase